MKRINLKKSDGYIIVICDIENIKKDIMDQLKIIKDINGDYCEKPISIVFNKMDNIANKDDVLDRIIALDLGRYYNGSISNSMTCLIENEYYGEIHTRNIRKRGIFDNPVKYIYESLINKINQNYVDVNGPIYI